jgi:hypothetical protein
MLCERQKSRAAVLRRREQTRSSSANDKIKTRERSEHQPQRRAVRQSRRDRARCASRARVLVVATKDDSTLDARRVVVRDD